jgi:hypothetical protein
MCYCQKEKIRQYSQYKIRADLYKKCNEREKVRCLFSFFMRNNHCNRTEEKKT